MDAKISKSELSGKVRAPPSKSYTQRALACALLADGKTKILNPSSSEDAMSALNAARMLGAEVTISGGRWEVSGGRVTAPESAVDCGGSATALRLFTAVSARVGHGSATVLTGNEQLRRRPMGALLEAMNSLGARCFSTRGSGLPPLVVMGGGAEGGTAEIRGDISSQFISSMLMLGTFARRGTEIRLTSALESKSYVYMTLDVLRRFGGEATFDEIKGAFAIPPQQSLKPTAFRVEGDFSSAAFMLVAGALCGKVEVEGIGLPSLQGDSAVVEILKRMGANISCSEGSVISSRSEMNGTEIDARQIPDLVPVLAVAAARAEGETTITGIRRLRYKESDRVATVKGMVKAMGGIAMVSEDSMTIKGVRATRGSVLDPSSDHRIAMACSILAMASEGETIIKNAECVSKSYPSFFEDLSRMGARVEMIV